MAAMRASVLSQTRSHAIPTSTRIVRPQASATSSYLRLAVHASSSRSRQGRPSGVAVFAAGSADSAADKLEKQAAFRRRNSEEGGIGDTSPAGSRAAPVESSLPPADSAAAASKFARNAEDRANVISKQAAYRAGNEDETSNPASGGGGGIGGGGRGSGSGGGSGGGGGGGSSSGGGGAAGGGWDPRRIWALAYGLAIIGGGIYAYKEKGSQDSFIASIVIGSLMLVATYQMGGTPGAGTTIAAATTGISGLFMGNKYRESRKFNPTGLIALVSLASTAWFGGWLAL